MVANNRVEFVPSGHPTRKGDAPLFSAHAERWPGETTAVVTLMVVVGVSG